MALLDLGEGSLPSQVSIQEVNGNSLVSPAPKLSETILEFGEPMLSPIAAEGAEAMRAALGIVILVWNTYTLSRPAWGEQREAEAELGRMLAQLATDGAPPEFVALIEDMKARRESAYGGDIRAVGDWELVDRGDSDFTFRCETRGRRD